MSDPTPARTRLLIVDDSRSVRNSFAKIFNSRGVDSAAEGFEIGVPPGRQAGSFELSLANQGEEALLLLQAALGQGQPFAVAFVDMRMPPGWDGLETIARLWQQDPDLQVVLCTAYSDYSWEDVVERLGSSDALLILKKPFEPIEVLQLAHALAEKWRLRQASKRCEEVLTNAVEDRTRLLQELNQRLQTEVEQRMRANTRLEQQAGELRHSHQQLRALAHRLEQAREEERRLLAREFHDTLGQELTRIRMDLSLTREQLRHQLTAREMDALRERLGETTRLVDEACQSVHRIARQLRPPLLDTLGLASALEEAARDFQTRSGITCRVRLPAQELPLAQEYSAGLFRITQEALANVARHARAGQVEIGLARNPHDLCLHVSDDGRGITERELNHPHALGLLGMRERALMLGAELTIKGTPGQGTSIEVRLPLGAAAR